MVKILNKEDGKVLGVILWIFGMIVLIAMVAVLLTVTKAYKYPPAAVNWPVVGTFIAQYGDILKVEEETAQGTEGEVGAEDAVQAPTAEEIAAMGNDPSAIYLRNINQKTQQIDDLKGQLEDKNDQIAKLDEKIQSMKSQLDNYKPENRQAIIKIYDKMDADAAVEVLSQLAPDRAVVILSNLKNSKAAEILGKMSQQRALEITELMAGFAPSAPDMNDAGASRRVNPPSATGLPQLPTNPTPVPVPVPQDQGNNSGKTSPTPLRPPDQIQGPPLPPEMQQELLAKEKEKEKEKAKKKAEAEKNKDAKKTST